MKYRDLDLNLNGFSGASNLFGKINNLENKSKYFGLFSMLLLLLLPFFLYFYFDSNSSTLGLDLYPDYLIPNQTLKTLGILVGIGVIVLVVIVNTFLCLLFYTFGLGLTLKQDLRILYKFTIVPNILLYLGASGVFISIRRIPYYNENFEMVLIVSLLLLTTSSSIGILNSVRWFKFIRALKKLMHPGLHFEDL